MTGGLSAGGGGPSSAGGSGSQSGADWIVNFGSGTAAGSPSGVSQYLPLILGAGAVLAVLLWVKRKR